MNKILLLKVVPRSLLSATIGLLFVVVLLLVVSMQTHGQWQRETSAHRAWATSDRPQLCAQIRGGALSPVEALAKAGEDLTCQSGSTVRLRRGPDTWTVSCESMARSTFYQSLLAAMQLGCESKDPGSFLHYLRTQRITSHHWMEYEDESVMRLDPTDLAIHSFLAALATFLFLSGGRLLLTETHLGWMRIGLLAAGISAALAPLGLVLLAVSESMIWDWRAFAITVASAPAAFGLAVILVLGGKRTIGWIAAGFSVAGAATEPAAFPARARSGTGPLGAPGRSSPQLSKTRSKLRSLYLIAPLFTGLTALLGGSSLEGIFASVVVGLLAAASLHGLVKLSLWIWPKAGANTDQ